MIKVSVVSTIKKNIIKPLRLLLFVVMVIFSFGCEDDPLLDPNTETGEDKGSYGKLSLPSSNDIEKKSNPEIF